MTPLICMTLKIRFLIIYFDVDTVNHARDLVRVIQRFTDKFDSRMGLFKIKFYLFMYTFW